jgi:hypothetical protein
VASECSDQPSSVLHCTVSAVQGVELPPLKSLQLAEEYLQLCESYPSHLRMVRGHVHKLITVRARRA